MAKHLIHHECGRFSRLGIRCPFRLLEDDPEDEDKDSDADDAVEADRRADRLPNAIFGDRSKDEKRTDARGKIIPFPQRPKEAFRHGEGIAAIMAQAAPASEFLGRAETLQGIQERGGLQSIPDMTSLLSGRGPKAIAGLLTGLLVAEGLRRSGSSIFRTSSQEVQQSERRASKQLKGLSRTTRAGSPGGGLRGSGRGFLQNTGPQLATDLGFSGRRKLDREQSFVSSFPPGYFA